MSQSLRPAPRAFAALAAFTLLFAACSSNNQSSAPNGGGGSAAPSTAAESPGGSPSESGAPGSGAPGASFGQIGGTVSVVGSWSGAEQDSFLAMVKPWEDMTGVKVQYTGSRDLNAQLTQGIAGGNLPDLAGLPGPGAMREWYKQGALKPLDFIDLNAYKAAAPAGYSDIGIADDGKLLGIFTKVAVKGLLWYDPKNFDPGSPKTWDELTSTLQSKASGDTKPWCVGFESGAASGWPGTDWIEDFVVRQSGPDVYKNWVAGKQKWTSNEIKQAWQALGKVLDASYGGTNYVVNTNFGKAANPMFKGNGCLMTHQANFITDFFKNEAGATPADYAMMQMPDINSQFSGISTAGGDLFGMFHDTEQAKSLIQWLISPQAQEIWAKRGGFIASNKNVAPDVYPDPASKKAAEIFQSASTLVFDASDQMPNAMNDAFFKGVMKFTQNQGQLDSILQDLDQTQADAYNQ